MIEVNHHTSLEKAVAEVEVQISGLKNDSDRQQAEAWVMGARDVLTGGGNYSLLLSQGGILNIPGFTPVLDRSGDKHPALEAVLGGID
jgi:hypothetical protein